jgi:hypothetical protein
MLAGSRLSLLLIKRATHDGTIHRACQVLDESLPIDNNVYYNAVNAARTMFKRGALSSFFLISKNSAVH